MGILCCLNKTLSIVNYKDEDYIWENWLYISLVPRISCDSVKYHQSLKLLFLLLLRSVPLCPHLQQRTWPPEPHLNTGIPNEICGTQLWWVCDLCPRIWVDLQVQGPNRPQYPSESEVFILIYNWTRQSRWCRPGYRRPEEATEVVHPELHLRGAICCW